MTEPQRDLGMLFQTVIALSILLALAITAFPGRASASDSPWALYVSGGETKAVNAYDTPYLPGELAVFDHWFGESTHTLPPVSEAVVVDGVVKSVNTDGNTPIPKGGLVLSSSDPWMSENLQPGDRVRVAPVKGVEGSRTLTHPVHGVDAVRNTDMLIVYTPRKKLTGTNEWGFEATVKNGVVASVGGNNSPVPADGFVVSGHGAAGEWIRVNLAPGMRISYDQGTLTVTKDPGTYLESARLILAKVEGTASTAGGAGTAVAERLAEVRALLANAEVALAKGDGGMASESALRAQAVALTALPRAMASPNGEVRAVWMRVAEESPEEIRRTLDALAAANINTILPELFYGGRTLYPSALTEQLPQFGGWDPLEVWVREAHTRGISVHAWVHIFNFGEAGPGPILNEHPEWAATQRNGEWEAITEPGLYYGDPAHPGVQDFLSALLREMATKYALDGIELDYIRYPTGSEVPETAFSYSDYSRKAFKDAYGTDPMELKASDRLWSKWSEWRQGKVTDFVRRVRKELKELRPDLRLSAAVFGDYRVAKSTKMQDWSLWTDEGLLDFLSPMLYGTDTGSVRGSAKKVSARLGENAKLVAGIAPFMGLDAETLLGQVEALRGAGAHGVAFFAMHSLRGGQLGMLGDGPFRAKAGQP